MSNLTPVTAPAGNISGLKNARTRLQTVYLQSIAHLLPMLCVLMKILSHAETKRMKRFNFNTVVGLVVVFKCHPGSEGVNAGFTVL